MPVVLRAAPHISPAEEALGSHREHQHGARTAIGMVICQSEPTVAAAMLSTSPTAMPPTSAANGLEIPPTAAAR